MLRPAPRLGRLLVAWSAAINLRLKTIRVHRIIQRIAAKFDRVHFCYKAGPNGPACIVDTIAWPRM